MKDNFTKKIIGIICIFAMLLTITLENFALISKEDSAVGKTREFGIELLKESTLLNGNMYGKFGYNVSGGISTQNTNVYRIYTGNKDYSSTILCLDKNKNFPETIEYKSLGTANVNTLKQAKSEIDTEKTDKIQWLINYAILPEDTEELKNERLTQVFSSIINSNDSNNKTLDYIKSKITDDDLAFAAQYSLWMITNGLSDKEIIQGTSDGNNWYALDDITKLKGTYVRALITYYSTHFNNETLRKEENEEITNSTTNIAPVSFATGGEYDKTGDETKAIIENQVYIGPFKINKTSQEYTIDIKFKKEDGTELNLAEGTNYFIVDSQSKDAKRLYKTKESLEGKDFYIRLNSGTTIRNVSISLTSKMYLKSAMGTVWMPTTDGRQPLLTILREQRTPETVSKEKTFDITIEHPYDVSLRKYITAIKRQDKYGERVNIVPSESTRVPKGPIDNTETPQFNQYEYRHRKDPYKVEIGDKVVYTIKVTNESREKVRIKSIVDYLPPTGLEYADKSGKWIYSKEENKAVTDQLKDIILDFKESREITIECTVKSEAEGKTLTNIAEISEVTDENGKIVTDIDSNPNNIKLPDTEDEWEKYVGNILNKDELSDSNYYYKGQEDDDDFEKIYVKGSIDLALRKSIEKVNNESKNRTPVVDTTPLKNGKTTANYTHSKEAVEVKKGDIVVYTIRVYNEGTEDAYASKITDYIPQGLGYLPEYKLNQENGWTVKGNVTEIKLSEIKKGLNNVSQSDFTSTVTDYKNAKVLKGQVEIETTKQKDTELKAYDGGDKLSTASVQVACIVLDEAPIKETMRNIAAITEYKNSQKEITNPDRDSSSNNDLSNFEENNHEDDEDYEKIIIKEEDKVLDLALRKSIEKVNNESKNRIPVVDTTPLKNGKTTANYTHSKEAVEVKKGDIVVYTIRVYNEGTEDAYASKITDYIPQGLGYLPEYKLNQENGWTVKGNATEIKLSEIKKGLNNVSQSDFTSTVTDYKNAKVLKGQVEIETTKQKDTELKAYDGGDKLSTASVKVACIVLDEAPIKETMRNIAAITEYKNSQKEITNPDRDSSSNNDLSNFEENNHEDDEDYEKIIIKEEDKVLDLALRKSIEKVNNESKNRIPVVDTTPLKNGKTTANYTHSKEAVEVKKGDIVVYTIRVYNEGTEDAYASKITDYIPQGLGYLPEYKLNQENGWTVKGNVTEIKLSEIKKGLNNVSQSDFTSTVTDYKNAKVLKGQVEIETTKQKDTELKAYDGGDKLSTASVQVACIVLDDAPIKETMRNIAAITEYKNSQKEITNPDRDSSSNNDLSNFEENNHEDDEDYEKIIIKEEDKVLDLALRKSIEKVNNESKNRIPVVDTTPLKNGKTTANYTHSKEAVEVKKGDIVVYTIRVYNEGTEDAYASKITDYIPQGLGYLPEYKLNQENGWTVKGNATEIKLSEIKKGLNNVSQSDFTSTVTDYKNAKVLKGQVEIETTKQKDTELKAYDGGDKLSTASVQVACIVLDEAPIKETMRNIAAITEYKNSQKEITNPDRDSSSNNGLSNFNENNHEDDEDYEKIIIKEEDKVLDLALRKSIEKVNNESKNRTPVVDTTPLKNGKTTANYTHSKEAVEVKKGDIVVYTIRVYNEGTEDAYASKITDYIPQGLGYLPEYKLNQENGWTVKGNATEIKLSEIKKGLNNVSQSDFTSTVTDYKNAKVLKGQVEIETTKQKDTELKAYDGGDKLSTASVKVACIVLDEAPIKETMRNIAAITEYKNSQKEITNPDRDSSSNNDLSNFEENNHEDDEDYEKIIIKEEDKVLDLALRKSIEKVNNESKNRIPVVDTTPLKNGKTTANYTHSKEAVEVKKGDIVVYTIRVYNEGTEDAYASKITDYIPQGLGYLPEYKLNQENGWTVKGNVTEIKLSEIKKGLNNVSQSDFTSTVTDYKNAKVLKGQVEIETTKQKDTELKAYDGGDKLSTASVQVACIVLDEAPIKETMRNIAAITEYKNSQKEITNPDRDSSSNNDLSNFNENNHEDDEDYEKIIIKEEDKVLDLALRKSIEKVNNESKNRTPVVDTTPLKNGKTTANYTHSKEAVEVKKGDIVVYTIRVYNEGTEDAYASKITDYIPQGLGYLPEYKLNQENGWTVKGNVTEIKLSEIKKGLNNVSQSDFTSTVTDYKNAKVLKGQVEIETTKQKDTELKAYDGGDNLSSASVQVACIVLDDAPIKETMRNIAAITEYKNSQKEITNPDRDSSSNNDLSNFNENNHEDDEDYEKVIIPKEEPKNFDLALRKFITKIDKKDITNRIPKVVYENDKITYEHTKDPVVVVKGQIVTYTIRVYNEGEVDGYAEEIKDDLPEGITYLPDHETNEKYMWEMYDEKGEKTTDVSKAKTIRTPYLSKAESEKRKEDNLIKAFDKTKGITDKNPDYREVQVTFEVTKDVVTDGNKPIVNTAEISKDSGDDIDSTPDNDKDGEDDIDKEYLILKYFDLSLLKYVSKVIVTEDGVVKETETGYDGTENPEPVVKVELNKKKLDKTEVKWVYSIKITNEGEIDGYATEVTDRIPEGLAFFEEDNTEYNWKVKENGIVTTDYLKDTLLKPGESAIVQIVLRWEKSENNLGQKINVAEISEDDNEYDVPDIDSTPNNNKDGEDDQDYAIVVLSINTGSTPVYIVLITTIMVIVTSGSYMIYKHVIKG